MNRFFRKLPLQAKLMAIGLVPIAFMVFLTVELYQEKTQKLKLFENYRKYIEESADINSLIDALQEERKYSFDYAMTKSGRQDLVLQRPKTDALIQKITETNDPALTGFEGYTKLGELQNVRNRVDTFSLGPNEVMHFYSNTVFRLNTLNTIPPANTAYLQPVYKDLMVSKILSEMITYLGIIRSNIYNVLHTRKYMVETLFGTIGAHDVYKSYQAELLAKATPEVKAQFEKVRETTSFKPTEDYIDELFKTFKFNESFTAAEWWKVSDEGVNDLRKFQNSIWQGLNAEIIRLHGREEERRTQSLVFLIMALVMMMAVVTYIIYIITRALVKLRSAAEKISNGFTHVPINSESNDVIGNLAKSISKIDRNYQALAEAAFEIGRGNFEVKIQPRSEQDILGNAIHKMKEELQQYSQKMEQLVAVRTEELARSNEDLQQFAHVASHDLKEPLRKIAIFSSILANEQKDSLTDKGKLFLEKIENSARRMSGMIEGVLAYSTVSVNEPTFEIVDLNSTLEGVSTDLELSIIQKDARIIYSNLPTLVGMPLLLHQLFYNLVNNALKFSKKEEAPVVTIAVEQNSLTDIIHLTVKDNGIGFNPSYAEKMFGIFSRLNSKEKYEGTGLGLALCRKIMQRHGGKIYAEGEEGKGAVIHLLFPIRPEPRITEE